jgi:hypothetical protein
MRKNRENTTMRGKDAAGNPVSGICDLEYSELAVHPLQESRRT